MSTLTLTIENRMNAMPFDRHFANLVKTAQSIFHHSVAHYRSQGLTYMDVPAIVGITGACENVDTLFQVKNRCGIPLFFTQTGQLALEQSLQYHDGMYTIIHSGRDEEAEDLRHLRQFRLTEEEFSCTMAGMSRETYDEDAMYEALLAHIQNAVQSMIQGVMKENGEALAMVYGRNTARLEEAASTPFLRISYEDALVLLKKHGYPDVRFGDDLKSEHEAAIVRLLNTQESELPVFIMKYPKEIKFFNMKVSASDPRVVLSADLILPYAGEAAGSAVREHEFEKLNERLLSSPMFQMHLARGGTYEDFGWYLDIIKRQGTLPHAGYGIGNERVIQYIFGERDIRNVSIFSLLNSQTGDYDPGRAAVPEALRIAVPI